MSDQELQFKKLCDGHPLGLHEDACLVLRSPRYAKCRACEDVCPVRALTVGETALVLADSCVNCGRCASACPMGALAIPGFMVPDVKSDNPAPLAVDCWKVPQEISPEGGVRVPCLGGVSAGRLVELAMVAEGRPVHLLDRGWCSQCSSGGEARHPVEGALEKALPLLEAVGLASTSLPRLVGQSLPVQYLPMDIPAPMTQQALSRRAFFGSLASRTTAAIDQVRPLAPRLEVRRKRGFERDPVASRERGRLLHGLNVLAMRAGKSMPRVAFYQIKISQACRNHQVCAGTCPTGALDIYEEKSLSGVSFDAFSCIGCGHCETICPEDAVKLLPNGNSPVADLPLKLTRFGEVECRECGRIYTAQSGEDSCPQCAKRRNLASSAFRSLFGGDH